jgi:hypothetical protein
MLGFRRYPLKTERSVSGPTIYRDAIEHDFLPAASAASERVDNPSHNVLEHLLASAGGYRAPWTSITPWPEAARERQPTTRQATPPKARAASSVR